MHHDAFISHHTPNDSLRRGRARHLTRYATPTSAMVPARANTVRAWLAHGGWLAAALVTVALASVGVTCAAGTYSNGPWSEVTVVAMSATTPGATALSPRVNLPSELPGERTCLRCGVPSLTVSELGADGHTPCMCVPQSTRRIAQTLERAESWCR